MPIRSNLIQPPCQNNNVTDRNKVKGESRDLRLDGKIKERERERGFVCVCGCVYVKNKTDKKLTPENKSSLEETNSVAPFFSVSYP
ncbi:hypothetical protein I7I53_11376 [Histoplasma capsulatum var. duboisii H88]|uniref:Uncharacterized protein n=1 Tax=Ajellomyces capsulatus (strain H88) TaxID=544711 RepID=A0A8A1L881_AJEC8|nr:hypothetical protein I7I53_11376 [Histoplasma capsulatum var. duboisii H88]